MKILNFNISKVIIIYGWERKNLNVQFLMNRGYHFTHQNSVKPRVKESANGGQAPQGKLIMSDLYN